MMTAARLQERARSASAPGEPGQQGRLLVAVLDPDTRFVGLLTDRLAEAGFSSRALTAPASLHALVRMRLHALVVDLEMLGPIAWDYLSGICSSLPALAVVVCTRPTSVAQRTRGLRMGADAWMAKPAHPEEVACVIEAALRRRRHQLPDAAVATKVGEITLCPDLYQAYVNDQSAELTRREFELLHLFSQSPRVLRREEIYERIWGYAIARGDRSVDVYVRKLRQKLQNVSPQWSYIQTHFGVGYRFAPQPNHDAACLVKSDEEANQPQLAISGSGASLAAVC